MLKNWVRSYQLISGEKFSMSAWVFNVFKCRDTTIMMTLYKSMVRSTVEYCCPLWHTSKVGLTQKIEALQRTYISRIAQCQDMSYWERLKSLKLMPLQRRRERYVIMTMWESSFKSLSVTG